MSFKAKSMHYLSGRHRGMILGLLFVVGLVYVPYINNALFFDDFPFFSDSINQFITNPFHLYSRWLPYMSLAWTVSVFSDTPLPLHLGNLLLHFANTVLVFVLLQQLCSLALNQNKQTTTLPAFFTSPSNWGAWLGALAFACHPLAVYAVGYVVERSIVMATLFVLAMQISYIKGLLSPQKLQQACWLACTVLFYFCAVFSKEHSLMAPALLAAITLLLKPVIQANWRAIAAAWLGLAAIAIFVALRSRGIAATAEHDASALFTQHGIVSTTENVHTLSIVTQAGLFFKYVFLWLVPNPAWMSIDMREPFASTINSWQNWLKVACFMAYGAIGLKLLLKRGKLGLLGFALLYPWLLFFIEFSTVRVQEPFVLYRSYLWAPGLLLLIPLALDCLPKRKTVTIAFAVAILALIPLAWNRLNVFSDEYKLWNDAALLLKSESQPGAARIFYNRGLAELHQQKPKAAVLDFKRVIAIDPTIYQAYENLGSAYLGTGQFKEALASLNQAIAIKPDDAQAYFAKAFALKRLNDKAGATEALTKSCALKNVSACLIVTMSGKK
jgi:protein O-mannosyl-transferase